MMFKSSIYLTAAFAGSALATGNSSAYDYIVVGGGTAGLVIAGRLANNTDYTVLVIEAGPSVYDDPRVTAPDGFPAGTNLDWLYHTTAQEYTGTSGQVQYISSGKALGGTSAINGMAYTRSSAAQIDAWEALGNEGWNWETLYASTKIGETFHAPDPTQASVGKVVYDADYHGFDGPLTTGWRSSSNKEGLLFPIFAKSFSELGVETVPDVNGGAPMGFSNPPFTVNVDANMRQDAARAYYWPVLQNKQNLKALVNTTVERITWASGSTSTTDVTASGVVVTLADGTMQSINANREVIVSAGAVKSPALLEVSGVGNPDLLSSLGITPVVSLPGVGENLQEQTSTSLSFNITTNITDSAYFFTWTSASQLGLGNLSAEVKANLSSYASIQAKAYNYSVSAEALEKIFAVQHDLIFNDKIPAGVMGSGTSGSDGSALATRAWSLSPFSRGSIHITSSSLNDVAINPRYFMLDVDVQMFAAAVRKVREVYGTEGLAGIVGAETSPGLDVVPSNDDWVEYLSSTFNSNCHLVGTCAMLPKDLGGVVDSSAKVYGTTNLRVIDASIIPFEPSGPPTATIYGVAEKLAAIMLAEL
ncbi:hypothetical protein JX265_010158 [Neoarthrinium moseri]|uniref:Glucose-methanol-choline oxidoreductase N-terminal domain-containing protein n=1 Tax=Neoarthrinium moseri TaxID=1658444 RepID=A0A9Q0AM61_9PEZI|nr:hypothetical protein JX266_012541 [Neoarthrinium moseri]KAI1860234.1 hypothetical protein JX265_010158 [Neoarthrinium moseri]